MLRRTLLGLCAAFAVTAAPTVSGAQTPAAPAPATPAAPPAKPNPRVKLETTEGNLVIELYADKAPITVANYLKYVDRGLFVGAACFRASKPKDYAKDDYGLVQCGQKDPAKKLPPIAHESTIKTGLTHGKDGVISMGRFAPGTAQADYTRATSSHERLAARDGGLIGSSIPHGHPMCVRDTARPCDRQAE